MMFLLVSSSALTISAEVSMRGSCDPSQAGKGAWPDRAWDKRPGPHRRAPHPRPVGSYRRKRMDRHVLEALPHHRRCGPGLSGRQMAVQNLGEGMDLVRCSEV